MYTELNLLKQTLRERLNKNSSNIFEFSCFSFHWKTSKGLGVSLLLTYPNPFLRPYNGSKTSYPLYGETSWAIPEKTFGNHKNSEVGEKQSPTFLEDGLGGLFTVRLRETHDLVKEISLTLQETPGPPVHDVHKALRSCLWKVRVSRREPTKTLPNPSHLSSSLENRGVV